MKFDDILVNHIGDFGTYQKIRLFLVCVPALFVALHSLSWAFTGAAPKYRCLLIGETDNETFPFLPDNEYGLWLKRKNNKTEKCLRIVNLTVYDTKVPDYDDIVTESCKDGYKWDTSEFTNSAIKKWGFTCNQDWLKAFVHSFYYVGQLFGSFIFGVIADKYGRKNVFFVAIFIQIACGTAMAFVSHWQAFTFLRFCVGFAHPGIFVTGVVIGLEMVGPARRRLSSCFINILFASGEIVLGTLAYFMRDYQHLQLTISLPAIIFIAYWCLIPESARWLISNNRKDEAEIILKKIARANKTQLPDNWKSEIVEESKLANGMQGDKKYGFKDMFLTPSIRRHTLVFFVSWPVVSMAYYGLSMNPSFMGGDRYVSFMFGGCFSMGAAILILFTLNVFGRKFYSIAGFTAAASFLFISTAVPESYATTRMILVVACKMSVSATYATLYVFTPELYPTVIRTTAVGVCSMVARLGGIVASYVSLWLAEKYSNYVAIFYGVLCLTAAVLICMLPDTNGQPQLETLEDVENYAKKSKKFFIFGWQIKNQQNNDQKIFPMTEKPAVVVSAKSQKF